jgi:hypothetical protein
VTVGVNYPWRRYGGDFGPTVWGPPDGIRAHAGEIRRDLATLSAAGVEVVRWFVFTDARGGLAIDDAGWPAGIHPEALADADALCEIALETGVRLVPVLFDHLLAFDATEAGGATVGGRAAWIGDPVGQRRLLDTVVGPLALRYGRSGTHGALGRAICAWDLFNEPDWVIAELHPSPRITRPVPFDVFAAWVRDACALVRVHEAGQVTIGNARLRFARWWDDPAFGFDFLQAHVYYDPVHDFDLLDMSPDSLGVTRPLVLGECPARGDMADEARARPALPLRALAEAARTRGFAGVWPWSWRADDPHAGLTPSDLADVRAAFDA